MYMMRKINDLFEFFGFEKILHGSGIELLFKRNNKARALCTANSDAGAVANDGIEKIRDKSLRVASVKPRKDNRSRVQKQDITKKHIDFSF